MLKHRPKKTHRLAIAVLSTALFVVGPVRFPSAGAITGTATVNPGTLAFVSSPASIDFSVTLNGSDQNVTAAQVFNVGDATGSGIGWNLTATSTTFTSGGHSLSTTGTTVQAAPTVACDVSVTCTVATTNVSYPYSLPAGTTAPTATKLYNATAATGMGNQTVSATFNLAVPASTFAGTYTSTWTYSLVSGP